ncbi:hypothetical protein CWI37_0160p0010 [Hamiltosporidium tvaerminnensis]|uniref:Uncharacterized protein n=1 Tax=Hamiltosporidium tvaerminnensis TaxID=1176355 RepID=A0A4Q9L946_9MICR|nr:hypothetical protein LUQ84_3458 [Hamiltosporidium tvaerminnensis]TBU04269.1 hypothetical protein CWI37_0160p0010 [Hamiltosporidium tvaerminnensis]
MHIFVFLYHIYIFLAEIKTSPTRKKARTDATEDVSCDSSEHGITTENFHCCGFEKKFSSGSEHTELNKRKKETEKLLFEGEGSETSTNIIDHDILRNRLISLSDNSMTSDKPEPKNPLSHCKEESLLTMGYPEQSSKDHSTPPHTKLPSFQTVCPQKFYNQQPIKPYLDELIPQEVVLQLHEIPNKIPPGLENLANDSTKDECFYEKFSYTNTTDPYPSYVNRENQNSEIPTNLRLQQENTVANNQKISAVELLNQNKTKKHKIKYKSKSIKSITKLYSDITRWKCTSDDLEESVLVLQQGHGAEFEEQAVLPNFKSHEPVILSYLKNKNSNFYSNAFIKENDFEVFSKNCKIIVKFEKDSYLNSSTSEIMQNIPDYDLSKYSKELQSIQIHIFVPELNYILELFRNNNIESILRGHVLLVHYQYEIIRLLKNLIFEKNEEIYKRPTNEFERKILFSKNKTKTNLMHQRIFFLRILISDLFSSFRFDTKKIEIYRILNLIHHCSVFYGATQSYFKKTCFNLQVRFIFRFIFDSGISLDNYENDFMEVIKAEDQNQNIFLQLQNRFLVLFNDYFCNAIYIDKVLNIIDTYTSYISWKNKEFKIVKKIKELKSTISNIKTTECTDSNKIELTKIFLELEYRISHIEIKVLSISIFWIPSYDKDGYEMALIKIKKVFEKIIIASNK